MVAIENLETQLKGFVSIFYNVDVAGYDSNYMDVMKRVKKMLNDSLPYYNMAVHYCFNDPKLMGSLSVLRLVAGRDMRLRFRIHYGMSSLHKLLNNVCSSCDLALTRSIHFGRVSY